jgi:hypothetical protein
MIFDFTPEETDYIARTLSQRPFAEVANLIGKMQRQVQEQQQPQPPKEVPCPPESPSHLTQVA